MSSTVTFQRCPETGICSIYHGDAKVDLLPDEVAAIGEAAGNPDAIKAVLAESDSGFAAALSPDDLAHIGTRLA